MRSSRSPAKPTRASASCSTTPTIVNDPRPQRHPRLLRGQDRKELTMASLAPATDAPRPNSMSNVSRLDPETAWAAFMRRDRRWDGRVDRGGPHDRNILQAELPGAAAEARECRPSTPRQSEARAAGFRACMRCKPDEVGRDREAVARAVKLIEQLPRRRRRWPNCRRGRRLCARTISSASSSATSASRRPNMPGPCATAVPRRRSRPTGE